MCMVRSYSQASSGIAVETLVCLFMRFSLSAEELSKKGALLSNLDLLIYTLIRFSSHNFSWKDFFGGEIFFSFHEYTGHVSLFVWPIPTNSLLFILYRALDSYVVLWHLIAPVITYFASTLMLTGPKPMVCQLFVYMLYLKWECWMPSAAWEWKTTATSAKASQDSIACFCATADSETYVIYICHYSGE